jgi:hypothetical protein
MLVGFRRQAIILGVYQSQSLIEQSVERVVKREDVVFHVETEVDRIDVADLRRKGKRAQRLVEYRSEKQIFHWLDHFVERYINTLRDRTQRLLCSMSNVLVHV